MALARLHLAEVLAYASNRDLDAQGRSALAWADCLLRAHKPSPRRIEACLAQLRTAFDLDI